MLVVVVAVMLGVVDVFCWCFVVVVAMMFGGSDSASSWCGHYAGGCG